MRSALNRTLEMLCGRKPPLETWLPLPALLMPQVQCIPSTVQCQQGHVWLFIIPFCANYKYVLSLSLTGLILRRCTLDAVGLASWENPTHIKCVSKNYENIQMLVSPESTP